MGRFIEEYFPILLFLVGAVGFVYGVCSIVFNAKFFFTLALIAVPLALLFMRRNNEPKDEDPKNDRKS